jgi:hypothetical protein
MYSNPIVPIPFDFLPEGLDLVDLDDVDIEQAIMLSQNINHADPTMIRESYLALLGLQGFTKWIKQRLEYVGRVIQYDVQQARLIPAIASHQPAAITQIQLNQFRLCLISTTSSSDEMIAFHPAIVTQAPQIAHFYVHIALNPEAKVATVRGFIRYDQLQSHLASLPPTASHTYEISQSHFEPNLDRLLFFATGLNPQAIPLPQVQSSLQSSLAKIPQVLIQPAINTANWLNQQVTQFRQELETFLTIPNDFTTTLVPAFRGELTDPALGLPEMLQAIEQEGYVIPINVHASYQDLSLDSQAIRIIVVTWQLPEQVSEPEWSLLLIGQMLSPATAPIEIKIQQQEEILATAQLVDPASYQVQQAIGFLHEKFTVSLANSQTELILPPFSFQPQDER